MDPLLAPPDPGDSPAFLPPLKHREAKGPEQDGPVARWPRIASFTHLGPLAAIRRGGFTGILH